MTNKGRPAAPSRQLPEPGEEHYQLYKNVREAISSLPIYFRTETHISGIMATDLHTLVSYAGYACYPIGCSLGAIHLRYCILGG